MNFIQSNIPDGITNICQVSPEIVNKKWGYEKILVNCNKFCGKILHYNDKGSVSSFHFHPIKTELFIVKSGRFIFRWKDEKGYSVAKEIKEGGLIYIPNCQPHQLESLENNSEILEISTFHSDSDVVRISPGDSQK